VDRGQFVEAFLGIGEAERLVPVATGPFGRRFIQTEGAEARPFPYVGRVAVIRLRANRRHPRRGASPPSDAA
jgi:hypothetical protein